MASSFAPPPSAMDGDDDTDSLEADCPEWPPAADGDETATKSRGEAHKEAEGPAAAADTVGGPLPPSDGPKTAADGGSCDAATTADGDGGPIANEIERPCGEAALRA